MNIKKNLAVMVIITIMAFFVSGCVSQFKVQAAAETPIATETQIAAETQSRNFNKIIEAVVVIELKRTINENISNFPIGTGVFIREDGYILTNNHVVEAMRNNEDNLAVHYLPKTEYQSHYIGDPNAMRQRPRASVKIINYDSERDVALLKIDGTGFPTIKFGNDPKMGDEVFAIGNPLSLNWTVTKGIISREISIPRNFQEFDYFLQTDASINPGNSGGPLLNAKGELIGLNAGIVGVAGYPINIGLNLAVPIGDIRALLPRLMEEKTKLKRSFLGIEFIPPYQEIPEEFKDYAVKNSIAIPKERNGILIIKMEKGSSADQAGLRIGDIIQSIDEKQIISHVDFNQTVNLQKPGKLVFVEIKRQDKKKNLFIKLGEKP